MARLPAHGEDLDRELTRALLRLGTEVERYGRFAARARERAREIRLGHLRVVDADAYNRAAGLLLRLVRRRDAYATEARATLEALRRKR